MKNRELKMFFYPYLLELMKKENRNDALIKLALNTFLGYIFSGGPSDKKIPLYISSFNKNKGIEIYKNNRKNIVKINFNFYS